MKTHENAMIFEAIDHNPSLFRVTHEWSSPSRVADAGDRAARAQERENSLACASKPRVHARPSQKKSRPTGIHPLSRNPIRDHCWEEQ